MLADALRRIGLMGATIKSVQSGEVTFGAVATTDVTITAVDLSKSIVLVSSSGPAGNISTVASQYAFSAQMLNSTTVRLARTHSNNFGTTRIRWTVVEFSGSVSVQRGALVFVDNVDSIVNATIATVDLGKAFVIWSWRTTNSGTTQGGGHHPLVWLSSATQVRSERLSTVGGTTVEFQVVEIK